MMFKSVVLFLNFIIINASQKNHSKVAMGHLEKVLDEVKKLIEVEEDRNRDTSSNDSRIARRIKTPKTKNQDIESVYDADGDHIYYDVSAERWRQPPITSTRRSALRELDYVDTTPLEVDGKGENEVKLPATNNNLTSLLTTRNSKVINDTHTDETPTSVLKWIKSVKENNNNSSNWIDEELYFTYLDRHMNDRKTGTFTIFIVELFDIANIKDTADIQNLFKIAYRLIESHKKRGTFAKFGSALNEKISFYSKMCVDGPQGQEKALQTMSYIHQVMSSRNILLHADTNKALNEVDRLYDKDDTKIIFHVLKEVFYFPTATNKTANDVIHMLFLGVVSPLQRALNTKPGEVLFVKINDLIEPKPAKV